MSSFKKESTYFNTAGKENTDTVLNLVKRYVQREDVKDVIVASTTGETGVKASEIIKRCNVVVVTHSSGFKELGKNELLENFRREIVDNGGRIFTGTHALSSAERAIRKNFGTIQPLELFANVLRLFGEGTKVCVEITLMAMDAGLISGDKDVVAVAGSGRGADTALRIHPANSAQFFDLKIREVIAKPSSF